MNDTTNDISELIKKESELLKKVHENKWNIEKTLAELQSELKTLNAEAETTKILNDNKIVDYTNEIEIIKQRIKEREQEYYQSYIKNQSKNKIELAKFERSLTLFVKLLPGLKTAKLSEFNALQKASLDEFESNQKKTFDEFNELDLQNKAKYHDEIKILEISNKNITEEQLIKEDKIEQKITHLDKELKDCEFNIFYKEKMLLHYKNKLSNKLILVLLNSLHNKVSDMTESEFLVDKIDKQHQVCRHLELIYKNNILQNGIRIEFQETKKFKENSLKIEKARNSILNLTDLYAKNIRLEKDIALLENNLNQIQLRHDGYISRVERKIDTIESKIKSIYHSSQNIRESLSTTPNDWKIYKNRLQSQLNSCAKEREGLVLKLKNANDRLNQLIEASKTDKEPVEQDIFDINLQANKVDKDINKYESVLREVNIFDIKSPIFDDKTTVQKQMEINSFSTSLEIKLTAKQMDEQKYQEEKGLIKEKLLTEWDNEIDRLRDHQSKLKEELEIKNFIIEFKENIEIITDTYQPALQNFISHHNQFLMQETEKIQDFIRIHKIILSYVVTTQKQGELLHRLDVIYRNITNQDLRSYYHKNDFENSLEMFSNIIVSESENPKSTSYYTLILWLLTVKNLFADISKELYNINPKVNDIDFSTLDSSINEYLSIADSPDKLRFFYLLCHKNVFENLSYEQNWEAYSAIYESLKEEIKINSFKNMLFSAPVSDAKTKISIVDTDLMTGYDFEEFIANLFTKMGYHTYTTKKSGDQGIDVIAEKNGEKIAIQTKCYTGNVGNSAIQEVVAGKNLYDANKLMVITNSYFTPSAVTLAKSNNVILWDRDNLTEKIKSIMN